ncbi:Titin [Gossypium arboreum]|uniref:Titin n=1 Tax=Gossypium arboreum TaxID=29729 RepID=A0A0B0MJN2_GOSAR|nr:Titin [Gossypium arboreum]
MPFTQRTFHCHWRKGLRVFSRGALNFPLFHFTFHCFSRVPVGDPVSSVDWCSQGPLQTGHPTKACYRVSEQALHLGHLSSRATLR